MSLFVHWWKLGLGFLSVTTMRSWVIVCSSEETVKGFFLYPGVKLPRRQILCFIRIIVVLYVHLVRL